MGDGTGVQGGGKERRECMSEELSSLTSLQATTEIWGLRGTKGGELVA